MARGLGLIFILIILIFTFGKYKSEEDGERDWKNLSANLAGCQGQVAGDKASGLIVSERRSNDFTKIEVDEYIWNRILHKSKIATALGIYCLNGGPRGAHTVMVYGARDGKLKGSLVNGQWTSY